MRQPVELRSTSHQQIWIFFQLWAWLLLMTVIVRSPVSDMTSVWQQDSNNTLTWQAQHLYFLWFHGTVDEDCTPAHLCSAANLSYHCERLDSAQIMRHALCSHSALTFRADVGDNFAVSIHTRFTFHVLFLSHRFITAAYLAKVEELWTHADPNLSAKFNSWLALTTVLHENVSVFNGYTCNTTEGLTHPVVQRCTLYFHSITNTFNFLFVIDSRI